MPYKKKLYYVVMIILAAVILCIYFSSMEASDNSDISGDNIMQIDFENKDDIEKRMEEVLSQIKGAGEVKVMITYDSGPEIIPATSTSTENDVTTQGSETSREVTKSQEEIVTIDSSGEKNALILKEIQPEIKGVIVISQGAGDISVKMNLFEAAKTLLNISADKVDVFEMTTNNFREGYNE